MWEAREYQLITPHSLDIDHGIFLTSQYAMPPFPPGTVLLQEQQLLVSCTCHQVADKLMRMKRRY